MSTLRRPPETSDESSDSDHSPPPLWVHSPYTSDHEVLYASERLSSATAAPAGQWQTVTRYRLHLAVERFDPYDGSVRCDRPDLAASLLHCLVEGFDREVVGALLLDARHHAIGHTVAYVGTLTSAPVEPRGILVPALLANAAGLVVWHTHPSGDPTPSADDKALTERLVAGGKLVGVPVLDHIILGSPPRFASFATLGLMDTEG